MILGIIVFIIVIGVIVFLAVSFGIMIFGGGPFVPTPMDAVKKILKYAEIKKGDKMYDIGAGDGRFVHFAAKLYGANSVGFELDPFVFFLAKLKQWIFGWKGRMIRGNFTKQDISDADIITCYLMPKSLAKLQKKFDSELKPGTKIISYAFHIGNWKAKKIIPKQGKINQIFIYQK